MTQYERFKRRMEMREAGLDPDAMPLPQPKPSKPMSETMRETIAYVKMCRESGKVPFGNVTTEAERRFRTACENERKYAGVGLSAEDRIMLRFDENRKRTFTDIGTRLMCGVGDCHSNGAVIRRVKYGKGNLTKRGFLKQPIEN